jgi:hypothetical protein
MINNLSFQTQYPRRPKKQARWLRMWLGVGAVCFSTIVCSKSAAPVPKGIQTRESPIEIRLDFRPFTDPTSTFLTLRGDGQAQALRYSPYQMTVGSFSQGTLPQQEVTRLVAKTREPAFREALQRKDYSGAGLSRGDQFYLSLEAQGGEAREAFGFVPDAPEAVRAFIADLLALAKRLEPAILAEAYLTSRPIEPERLTRLRSAGKVRLVPVSEFPVDLQPIITRAIRRSRDFHALSRAQYEQLLKWSSQGHDLFVLDGDLGYQQSLYQSRK